MSVLIKGVEMPDGCMECGACMQEDDFCDFCFCGFDDEVRKIPLKLHFRPAWCPMVEVEDDDDSWMMARFMKQN